MDPIFNGFIIIPNTNILKDQHEPPGIRNINGSLNSSDHFGKLVKNKLSEIQGLIYDDKEKNTLLKLVHLIQVVYIVSEALSKDTCEKLLGRWKTLTNSIDISIMIPLFH